VNPDAPHGSRGPGLGAAAFVPAAVTAAVMAGLVWATGTLSALLAHGQRPAAGLQEMGAVAVRLARHPSAPAAAWPQPDQHLIPGPAGFYATLLALLAVAIVLLAAAWRGYWRLQQALPGGGRYGAAWATRRDLRDLVVSKHSDLTGRIVLGRPPWRQTIASTLRHSLLLFGPTLSGKTTSFVIPTVLRWRGPVIATSSKVDLLKATIQRRARRGRVYVLDPFRASGEPSIRWSPLVGCKHWAGALDMAYWLSQAASVSHSIQSAEFWETLARGLLAPLLYAAANKPSATMLTVVRWCHEYALADEVLAVFDALEAAKPDDPAPRLARSALLASVKADPRRKDSIYGTAQVLLDVYRYPAVAETASGCDIDRDAFLRGYDAGGKPVDNTVFVFAPEHRQDQLRPLFEAFICWLIRAVEDHYAATNLAQDPPLLVMLDEAANICPLRKLGTYASSLASQGVQLCAVFQNLGQIKDRYGPAASTIVTNFLCKVLMGSTTDRELLELLTTLIGREELAQESLTYGLDGSRTATASVRQRDLAPIHALAQQQPGHALALLSHRKPVRLRVRPYTKLPEFRQRRRPPRPAAAADLGADQPAATQAAAIPGGTRTPGAAPRHPTRTAGEER
jgi:type IV secretory pathway TraG/TraD family ATPase VirD4